MLQKTYFMKEFLQWGSTITDSWVAENCEFLLSHPHPFSQRFV